MKKIVIKSNAAFALIGNSPAWTTGQDSGRLLSLVQNCNLSISNDRQKIKQIGSQSYAVNDIIKTPDVELSMDYYLTPYINNELLFGMLGDTAAYQPALQNLQSKNHNIYVIVNTENGQDGFDEPRIDGSGANFSGFNAMTFGNCYLNKYSVSFSLGQIPVVSVGMDASNVRFESLTGNKIPIPAINSVSGNNSGSGNLNLSDLYKTITGSYIQNDSESRTEYNAPVVNPNASIFSLQNLQIGGVNLSQNANPLLQSFSLDLDLARIPLYGLGSNYIFDRKLQFPANGQVQISCLVSGIASGQIQSSLINESGYSLEIAFSDSKSLKTGFYKIENAKLDNSSISMQVNNTMQLNASFSFEANENGGFLMKRSIGGSGWNNIQENWQNANFFWNS
jgi:hypothetical protein